MANPLPNGDCKRDELLSPKEAAAYVGNAIRRQPYALRTFYNLCSRGEMSPPDEIRRRRPRWLRSTLDAWVTSQVTTPKARARRQSRQTKPQ